jgi:hypothetical protein
MNHNDALKFAIKCVQQQSETLNVYARIVENRMPGHNDPDIKKWARMYNKHQEVKQILQDIITEETNEIQRLTARG